MSNIGIAVVEITKANVHRLLYANKNFYLTRNYKPEELQEICENNVAELLDMESKISLNIIVEEALKYKKRTINFDIKVNCKGGKCKCLLCKGKFIYKPERITMNIIEVDVTGVSENLAAGIL